MEEDMRDCPRLVGAVFCVFFVGMNVIGVREAARLQVGLVFMLLALLALYVFRGLPAVDMQNLQPFAPGGFRAVFATADFVFVSYGGLPECQHPGSNPLQYLGSMGLSVAQDYDPLHVCPLLGEDIFSLQLLGT